MSVVNKSGFMTILIAMINVAVLQPSAHAGNEGAHGGEVVVCPGRTPLVYDTYEAKTVRNLTPDLGPATLTTTEKVKLALDRYSKRDSDRAGQYQKWADSFLADAQIGNFDVAPVNDSEAIVLPPGCSVEQMIDQKVPQFDGDKRYFVSSALWNQLDSDQQAIAILHEVIYREAIELGLSDSVGVRAINSFIFSGSIATLTDEGYWNLMLDAQFITEKMNNTIMLAGHTFVAQLGGLNDQKPSFFQDGHLQSYEFLQDSNPTKIGDSLTLSNLQSDEGLTHFFDNGAIQEIEHLESVSMNFHGRTLTMSGDTTFDNQGNLLGTYVGISDNCTGPNAGQYFKVQGQNLEFVFDIEFYPDGNVKSGYLADPLLRKANAKVELLDLNGKTVKVGVAYNYFKRPKVSFDETGRVISVTNN